MNLDLNYVEKGCIIGVLVCIVILLFFALLTHGVSITNAIH